MRSLICKKRLGYTGHWGAQPWFQRMSSSCATDPAYIPSKAVAKYPGIIVDNKHNNVSENIAARVGTNLHLQSNHPLCIIKEKIHGYFNELSKKDSEPTYAFFDELSPLVSTKNCFDDLLTEENHVSRRPTDTYYVDEKTVLRTHTTAHQTTLIGQKHRAFLVTGDVYRRDEIDASHYPVFHQMDGVRLFPELMHGSFATTSSSSSSKSFNRAKKVDIVEAHLKNTLEGMITSVFGEVEMRWVDAYFPFTHPSYELEIFFNGDWLEVLGCGVMRQEILRKAEHGEELGWAFGLGLERLAMVLFDIPDIRLFWSKDSRFVNQFKAGEITKFTPYSKYPPCYKDLSFWQRDDFHENNLCEIVRDVAGDIVEQVSLLDEFTHPKTHRVSKCYRITYRHMDRNLTNDEVDQFQNTLRDRIVQNMGVELR